MLAVLDLLVLHVNPHLTLNSQGRLRQDQHTAIIDVENIILVDIPTAQDLGRIFCEPPEEGPDPHEEYEGVRLRLDQTFSLDVVRTRLGPKHRDQGG